MTTQLGASLRFRGNSVFSTVGRGNADVPHAPVQKLFWLVETRENGEMTICPLDDRQWIPVGTPRKISVRELQTGGYKPEPEIFKKTVFPRLQDKARLPAPEEIPAAAKVKKDKSLDRQENSMRSMFDDALNQARQGNLDSANILFLKLLKQADLSEEKHKHLFNEFGINLRKNKLFSHSIEFYARAIELTGEEVDENLHFNIARALFDGERYLACTQHLFKALKISPENWAVLHFLAWMQKHALIPKQYHLDVKSKLSHGMPPLPANITGEKSGKMQTPATGNDLPHLQDFDCAIIDSSLQMLSIELNNDGMQSPRDNARSKTANIPK